MGEMATLVYRDGRSEVIEYRGGHRIIQAFRNPLRTGSVRDFSEIYLRHDSDGVPHVLSPTDREHPRYDPTIHLERRFNLVSWDGGMFTFNEAGVFDSDGKPYAEPDSGKDVPTVARQGGNIQGEEGEGG